MIGSSVHDETIINRARAWYAIHLESMVDAVTTSILPHTPDRLDDATCRNRIHGLLRGIVSAMLTPTPPSFMLEEMGGAAADLLGGTRAALADFRPALVHALRADLPDEIRSLVDARVELVVTHICWGYVAWAMRENEPQADAHARAPSADQRQPGDNPAVFESVFQQHIHALMIHDVTTGKLIAGNPAVEALFGYTAEEFDALDPETMRVPETPDDDFDLLADLLAGRINHLERDGALRHRDGHTVRYRLDAWLVRADSGEPVYFVAMMTGLEAATAIDIRAVGSDKRFRYLAQLSLDPIFVVAGDSTVQYASPSTERTLGVDPEMVVGTGVGDMVFADDRLALRSMLAELESQPRKTTKAELRLRRGDGTVRWFELSGSNLEDVPEVTGVVLQARDITERKDLEQQLAEQAIRDPLTNLLNRRGILDQIECALQRRDASVNDLGLLFLDLDRFKAINDQFGHQTGDEALKVIAHRLATFLDRPNIVGRLGGDEFVMLVEHVDQAALDHIVEAVTVAMDTPIELHGRHFAIGGSVGAALSSETIQTSDALLSAADKAHYLAKSMRRTSKHKATISPRR